MYTVLYVGYSPPAVRARRVSCRTVRYTLATTRHNSRQWSRKAYVTAPRRGRQRSAARETTPSNHAGRQATGHRHTLFARCARRFAMIIRFCAVERPAPLAASRARAKQASHGDLSPHESCPAPRFTRARGGESGATVRAPGGSIGHRRKAGTDLSTDGRVGSVVRVFPGYG